MARPFKFVSLVWPPSPGQWKILSDGLEDIYRRLRDGIDITANLIFTRLSTGFTIAGGTDIVATLTVGDDASVSGSNTGDQTITLTGDVTGSGTGSFPATLATVNSNVGSFGSATKIPTVTVNAKGLVTAASETTVTAGQSSAQIFARILLRN